MLLCQLTVINKLKFFGYTLVWGPVLIINYDFCLKLLICCLLIVSKVVAKFRYGVD